jgi:PIN domain nuclease of toxin-antitoxin system
MIVADTHVIIWDALKPAMLSRRAKRAISKANSKDGIIFCEISLWEIAMLMKKGRLSVQTGYQDFVRLVSASNKYVFRGITPTVAELSTELFPGLNKDPADRIIAATAITEKAKLITADGLMQRSKEVATIW